MAKQMPGLKKYTVHKVVGAPRGDPAYYQVVELEFDNMDSMKKDSAPQPGDAQGDKALRSAKGELLFFTAEPKKESSPKCKLPSFKAGTKINVGIRSMGR